MVGGQGLCPENVPASFCQMGAEVGVETRAGRSKRGGGADAAPTTSCLDSVPWRTSRCSPCPTPSPETEARASPHVSSQFQSWENSPGATGDPQVPECLFNLRPPCPPGLVRGDQTFAQEPGEQLRGGQREKLSFPRHSWREERTGQRSEGTAGLCAKPRTPILAHATHRCAHKHSAHACTQAPGTHGSMHTRVHTEACTRAYARGGRGK